MVISLFLSKILGIYNLTSDKIHFIGNLFYFINLQIKHGIITFANDFLHRVMKSGWTNYIIFS